MNRQRLIQQLKQDEGIVLKPYKDSVGKLTIGIGRNLDDVGISEDEAEYLLRGDIDKAVDQAMTFPWYMDLNDVRQEVVINMIFNLGIAGFKRFVQTIQAIAAHDWQAASEGMLKSKWAGQVGNRALRLSEAMRTGAWSD